MIQFSITLMLLAAEDSQSVKADTNPVEKRRSLSSSGAGRLSVGVQRRSSSVRAGQPGAATEFVLAISGCIDGAQVGAVGYGPLAVSYTFHSATPDWTLVHGSIQGMSQFSHPRLSSGALSSSIGVQADDIVWNLPLALTYRSTNPHGWPRLVLTIEGDDWLGRRVVAGYSVVTVPTTPGIFLIRTATWTCPPRQVATLGRVSYTVLAAAIGGRGSWAGSRAVRPGSRIRGFSLGVMVVIVRE